MSNQSPPCSQQEVFVYEVYKAVEAVHKAQAEMDNAEKGKKETIGFRVRLANARIAERRAVAALKAHTERMVARTGH
jgi:hypothetical protein